MGVPNGERLMKKFKEAVKLIEELLKLVKEQEKTIHYLKLTNELQTLALKEQQEYVEMLENELYSN